MQQHAVLFHVSPEYLRRFLEIWAWDCDLVLSGIWRVWFWWPILKMDIIWKLLHDDTNAYSTRVGIGPIVELCTMLYLGLERRYKTENCTTVISMNQAFKRCPFCCRLNFDPESWIPWIRAFGWVRFLAKRWPNPLLIHLLKAFFLLVITMAPIPASYFICIPKWNMTPQKSGWEESLIAICCDKGWDFFFCHVLTNPMSPSLPL